MMSQQGAVEELLQAARFHLQNYTRHVLRRVAGEPHPTERHRLLVDSLGYILGITFPADAEWDARRELLLLPDLKDRLMRARPEGLSAGRLNGFVKRVQLWVTDVQLPHEFHRMMHFILAFAEAVDFHENHVYVVATCLSCGSGEHTSAQCALQGY